MGDFDCCTGRGECSSGATYAPGADIASVVVPDMDRRLQRVESLIFQGERQPKRYTPDLLRDVQAFPSSTAVAVTELLRRLHEQDMELRATLPTPPPGYRWHDDLRVEEGDHKITAHIVYQLRPIDGTQHD